MRDDSVKRFLSDLDDGTVFCISDVPIRGSSYDSVKTQLSRACSSGVIERVARGIYHKPKFSTILNDFVPYRARDLVNAISRMNGWRVIPSGDACLNLLGLSTQVPATHVYLSDGPNHRYVINGIVLEFRHRSPRDLPASDRTAIIVQAVKARGRENCDEVFVAALAEYISKNNNRDLLEEIRNTTSWVREVITSAYQLSVL